MKLIDKSGNLELVHKDGNWVLKKEIGFSPVQMTAASAAACSAYVYEKILKKQRIPFELIGVDIDYERNEETEPRPISKIVVRISVKVAEKNQERAKKDAALIAANCPVVQSLNPNIDIVEQVEFV